MVFFCDLACVDLNAWCMHLVYLLFFYHWHRIFLDWQWFQPCLFHFLDRHDVVGSLFWLSFGLMVDFRSWLRWSQENSQGPKVEMVFLSELFTGGWRQENSFLYGEESPMHPRFLVLVLSGLFQVKSLWLRVQVIQPLESLLGYVLVYPM